MHALVDYRSIQEPTSGNYFALLALAKQMVGERFLFARRGYPEELHLHFGQPIQTRGPKERVLTRGSYIVSSVASAWAFKSAKIGGAICFGEPYLSTPRHVALGSPLKDEELDHLLAKAATSGAVVALFDIFLHPFGYGLSLGLSDNSIVTVSPSPDFVEDEGKLPEVPDWELFTPYNRYLRVGPGPKWAYLPSGKQENGPVPAAEASVLSK